MATARQQDTLSATAYERIRKGILTGAYPLGGPLSRRRLAGEFGMSLIPVAEALQQLENEGLVESMPRVGTRVRIPTGSEIRGHYQVREALESQAARLFAELAGPVEKRDMVERAVRLDQSAALAGAGQREKINQDFEREHMEFHLALARGSQCDELVTAIMRSRVLVFNWLFNVATAFEPLPANWHGTLMAALIETDPLQADAAMRRHVRFRREETIQQIEQMLARDTHSPRIVRGPQRRNGFKPGELAKDAPPPASPAAHGFEAR